jgi:tetratricopeptide (TPR) repeat protein
MMRSMNLRALFAALLVMVLPAAAGAQSSLSTIALRLVPSLDVPVAGAATAFTLGGGGSFLVEYKPPLAFPLNMSVEIGYGLQPLSYADPLAMNVFLAGAGVGVQVPFLTRMSFGASVRGGYFLGLLLDELGRPVWGGNPYASATADLSFFVTPSFSIGLGAGARLLLGPQAPLLTTVGVTLGALYRFPISGSVEFGPAPARPSPLKLSDVQTVAILPAFFPWYDDHPIGRATLMNQGKAAAKDIRVSVFVRSYMDSPKVYGVEGEVAPGAKKDIDLYALFTEKVLEITEGIKAAAEIEVSFTAGGEAWKTTTVETVRLENRNASMWDDDRRAAAFVTARDPAVTAFAKTVASLVRNGENQSLDYGLRAAMAMHGALTLAGIGYVPDAKTPYVEYVKNAQAIDNLQFPRQTLGYRSGDCDDLTILYCALLSAASVDTAFITAPGHIYMAVALDAPADEAAKAMGSPDDVIVQGGRAWVPLEVTLVRESFLTAWLEGAREWRDNAASGTAKLYPLADAWKVFDPVGLPGEAVVTVPPEAAITSAYRAETARVADRIIGSRVKELEARIALTKDPQRLLNSLGALYARVGLLDKAEQQFTRSAAVRAYAPALVNLGNIALLKKAPQKALGFYQEAVRQDGGNPAALAGLVQSFRALGRTGDVDAPLKQLAAVAPDLVKKIDAASNPGTSTRAGDAAAKEVVTWDE